MNCFGLFLLSELRILLKTSVEARSDEQHKLKRTALRKL